MDLLHSGAVGGFCIVSSDSDYTRLATRIREQGLFVMGVGRRETAEAFVKACEVFVYTENLTSPEEGGAQPPELVSAPSGSPWRPQGEVSRPVFCFVSPDAFSPEQDWLSFDGGLAISLGGTEQHVSHRVRAPGG